MTSSAKEVDLGVVREIRPGTDVAGTHHRYGVEIVSNGACASCALVKACNGEGSIVWASSLTRLRVGQRVRLDMNPGSVLKATGWVYGIPLGAVVLGILVAYFWIFADASEAVRSILSTLSGIGLMLATGALLSRKNKWLAAQITVRAMPT